MSLLKRFAARLPALWQLELKRLYFARQIKKGTFESAEPEYHILSQLIKPGDWIIDVGANVGHYTKRFSEIAGANGRVIAFEPVSATFNLLAANAQLFTHPNVTLINAAASDQPGIAHMSIPRFSTGLDNYYEAQISSSADSALPVLTLPIDSLGLNQRIALIKIDAEGHEQFVINGMKQLLSEHHPILIVETGSKVSPSLSALGYVAEKLDDSPNTIFKFKPAA